MFGAKTNRTRVVAGPAGPTGPAGPAGTNGTNGTQGATGPTGPAGSAPSNVLLIGSRPTLTQADFNRVYMTMNGMSGFAVPTNGLRLPSAPGSVTTGSWIELFHTGPSSFVMGYEGRNSYTIPGGSHFLFVAIGNPGVNVVYRVYYNYSSAGTAMIGSETWN